MQAERTAVIVLAPITAEKENHTARIEVALAELGTFGYWQNNPIDRLLDITDIK